MPGSNNWNNNFYMNQQYLATPMQPISHQRSNSAYQTNQTMQIEPINYGITDDSQLINNYNQFSLINQNPYYTYNQQSTLEQYQVPMQNMNQQFADMNFGDYNSQQSLENNMCLSEGPISSVPLYMRKMRPIRSQSINREAKGSQYMKESFLFEKLESNSAKDDNILHRDQQPIMIENLDSKQFMPKILRYNKNDYENLSSVCGSSQSSMQSFGDGGSQSSLDLSFDGSGVPYIK